MRTHSHAGTRARGASRRPLVVAIFAGVLLGAVADARAEDVAGAAKDFQRGRIAFDAKSYREAALLFESAFRKSPRGPAMYGAGLCWQLAEDLPRAADALATALSVGGLAPPDEADAKTQLAAVERQVARLDLSAPAGARMSVAHVTDATPPVRVHVIAGGHDVRVTFADGRTLTRSVTASAGSVQSIDLGPAPPAATAAAATSPPPPSTLRTAGWVSGGVGVALAGTAVFLGFRALGARDDFDASDHTSQTLHDKAASLRAWTNVAWAGAALAGGLGLTLLLTAPSAPEPSRATSTGGRMVLSANASGVAFRLAF